MSVLSSDITVFYSIYWDVGQIRLYLFTFFGFLGFNLNSIRFYK